MGSCHSNFEKRRGAFWRDLTVGAADSEKHKNVPTNFRSILLLEVASRNECLQELREVYIPPPQASQNTHGRADV
jgi:hypothetical protein